MHAAQHPSFHTEMVKYNQAVAGFMAAVKKEQAVGNTVEKAIIQARQKYQGKFRRALPGDRIRRMTKPLAYDKPVMLLHEMPLLPFHIIGWTGKAAVSVYRRIRHR